MARAEVEFDPGSKIIPFPNNLLLDPATGKVALPEQCNESPTSAATRAQLNKLDGFAAFETTINVTFTEPVDVTTLPNRVLLFARSKGGVANDPATAVPIAVVPVVGQTARYGNQTDIKACTDPALIDQITFVPTVALDQKTTYTVALLKGVKAASGGEFTASFTWSLVRHPEPVVTIDDAGNVTLNRTPLDPNSPEDRASLAGVDLLWKAHHTALTFLAGTGVDPEETLLAWEFNTQTVTDPLDPAVAGSPASMKTALPLLGNASLAAQVPGLSSRQSIYAQCGAVDPATDTQCLLRMLLGAGNYAVGDATCAAAGCDNVDDVLSSLLLSKQFQADVPNTGYSGTGTQPIPGPWSDPLKPAIVHDTTNANPVMNDAQAKLGALVIVPCSSTCPTPRPVPAGGWPVVIFQHGVTRSRGDVLGVAGGLTGAGFMVVAMDAVNHGSRAVRISNTADADPLKTCVNVSVGIPGPRPDLGPDPTTNTDCYAPVLSADLAATRDAFRQTVLDVQQLVVSLKACGTTACGAKLKVDANNIFYLGHSLIGGSLGSMIVGTSDIQAAVLNAPHAGWLDVIENTEQTEKFQCPLVDALIAAGFITGAPYDPVAMTGLCTTDAWKTMLGYKTFAGIGRWMLDSADPANFGRLLAPKRFLMQEVVPDEVVPNFTTDNLGALSGRPRGDASCGKTTDFGAGGMQFLPSSAILATPNDSLFLEYLTVPSSADCPGGNTFTHGSLLKPEPGAAGGLATKRLQVDAAYYFLQNIE